MGAREVAVAAPKLENGGMIDLAFEWSRGGIYERPKTLQPYVARGFPEIGTFRTGARGRLLETLLETPLETP